MDDRYLIHLRQNNRDQPMDEYTVTSVQQVISHCIKGSVKVSFLLNHTNKDMSKTPKDALTQRDRCDIMVYFNVVCKAVEIFLSGINTT